VLIATPKNRPKERAKISPIIDGGVGGLVLTLRRYEDLTTSVLDVLCCAETIEVVSEWEKAGVSSGRANSEAKGGLDSRVW